MVFIIPIKIVRVFFRKEFETLNRTLKTWISVNLVQ